MAAWRATANLDPRIAGRAPAVGLLIGGVGVVVNNMTADGDIRQGILPWTLVIAVACFAWCSLGVLSFHGPAATRPMVLGALWVALAFCGMAGFFLALGVGSLLGIDEDEIGVAVWPPLLGMMAGMLSITPATATLAAGMTRARVVPWWSRAAAWVAAPALPVLLIYGGLTEGRIETFGTAAIMGLFGAAWIVIGISISGRRNA